MIDLIRLIPLEFAQAILIGAGVAAIMALLLNYVTK